MTSIVVRLPNHLGDACMTVPALVRLSEYGYAPTLVGRPWAKSLFEGYDWPVVTLPPTQRERVGLLRSLVAPDRREALLMTNSFSSALEFRLAGFRATGYARGGRSWLLARAVAVDPRDHMVEYYYRLATQVAPGSEPVPTSISLRLSASAIERARRTLAEHGVTDPYVVICPIAIGTHHGQIKAWTEFGRLATQLQGSGHRVVAMPGPGETEAVRAALSNATLLPERDVATFAAVLAGARLVLANDSGAGHLAAAVGAPLISVFGVTEIEKTRPWGPRAHIVGSSTAWPRYDDVLTAAVGALAT